MCAKKKNPSGRGGVDGREGHSAVRVILSTANILCKRRCGEGGGGRKSVLYKYKVREQKIVCSRYVTGLSQKKEKKNRKVLRANRPTTSSIVEVEVYCTVQHTTVGTTFNIQSLLTLSQYKMRPASHLMEKKKGKRGRRRARRRARGRGIISTFKKVQYPSGKKPTGRLIVVLFIQSSSTSPSSSLPLRGPRRGPTRKWRDRKWNVQGNDEGESFTSRVLLYRVLEIINTDLPYALATPPPPSNEG